MNDATTQLLYYYNRHPISRDIILAKLQASRGHLDNLRPEGLFPHDQDHYGGVKATDELARQAKIGSGTCFILEEDTMTTRDQGKTYQTKLLTLVDVQGNKVYGSFSPLNCDVQETKCRTEQEFRALIRPYMEDRAPH